MVPNLSPSVIPPVALWLIQTHCWPVFPFSLDVVPEVLINSRIEWIRQPHGSLDFSEGNLFFWSSVWPKEWPFSIKSSSTTWFCWSATLLQLKVLLKPSNKALPLNSPSCSKASSLVQSSWFLFSWETSAHQLETSYVSFRYLWRVSCLSAQQVFMKPFSWVDHAILDLCEDQSFQSYSLFPLEESNEDLEGSKSSSSWCHGSASSRKKIVIGSRRSSKLV